MKTLLFSFCLLFSAFCVNSQTHISISAPKYKGDVLTLCRYDNYITKNEKNLANCKIDSSGNSVVTVDIDNIEYVFMRYEKLVYYFFIQPNSSIEVIFSEKETLSDKEKLNPFFEPLHIAATVTPTSDNDFNRQLTDIDNKSDDAILAVAKYKKENDKHFKDSVIAVFKNSIIAVSNEFVNNYAKYRIAAIEYLFKSKPFKDLQAEYFIAKPVLYHNPAYCELLNHFNEKYLLHRTQQAQGNVFRQAVNKGDLTKIREMLSGNDYIFDKDFCDFLILQNAYNEFYDSNFSRSALLQIVNSIANETTNANNKIIAEDIRNTIVKLLAGYSPPDFELQDMQGTYKSLKSFGDKYIYLGFFSVNSYGSIQDFYLIDKLSKKFGEKVNFISICIDDKKDVENFIKSEKFSWTFLLCNNQTDILREYDVRAFPTYYLIDKNGKLLKSPAPSPSEDIYKILENLE
ncbi:MAG: TlpA family protein disulfide reductase [Prevotellaceae bacterium]|jgi:peroxiredoxin|nr:TlpA family protein disulfide reductase [Prevotellaceae bacterium]